MTRWMKQHWIVLTVAVVALSVGAALGGTAQPEAKTVTKTRVETVHDTRTVTKQVVPISCIETIRVLAKTNQTTLDIAGKAVTAAAHLDAAGIDAQTQRVAGVNAKIDGMMPSFNACMDKAG